MIIVMFYRYMSMFQRGRTAFMYALDKIHGDLPIEIFQYMLKKGADITERDCVSYFNSFPCWYREEIWKNNNEGIHTEYWFSWKWSLFDVFLRHHSWPFCVMYDILALKYGYTCPTV